MVKFVLPFSTSLRIQANEQKYTASEIQEFADAKASFTKLKQHFLHKNH